VTLLLLSLALFGAGAIGALLSAGRTGWPDRVGVAAAVAAGVVGIWPAVRAATGASTESLRLAWSIPFGSFFIELDSLSGFFLVPVFGVCALAAIYGFGYLRAYRDKSAAAAWFFFNLLAASMVVVIVARNAVLFLMAWETMALSSLYLVTFNDENDEARAAGWTYLVASHIGTAFLIVLFILLGRGGGSLDFDRFDASPGAGLIFVMALVGFGTKAGFFPLHVWLPEAHPAAPSHASAVMSAVMIKTGIYGLLRVLTIVGAPEAWWGWVLCAVGLVSALAGVHLALTQRDLKRLLAYSSVENSGIIAIGLGLGLVGTASGNIAMAVAGFAGALLHVLNHSFFKSLLFFAAGSVAHGAHTRDIERLGGLIKRMPLTGALFLAGSAAICALPPLNGFASEFLIYMAGFDGVTATAGGNVSIAFAAVALLALVGGLAVACFARAFGIAFLGHPRDSSLPAPHEPAPSMLVPAIVQASGCVLIGCLAWRVVEALGPVVRIASGLPAVSVAPALASISGPLAFAGAAGMAAIVVAIVLAMIRRWMLSARRVRSAVTWDCGYAYPTARMQYTGSSFVQPLTTVFASLLRPRRELVEPEGFFPQRASFESDTPDPCREYVFEPVFRRAERGLAALRPLQQGQVQLYVLYIAITLVLLLLWQLA
jgi:hydrogenase-4 component B